MEESHYGQGPTVRSLADITEDEFEHFSAFLTGEVSGASASQLS